MSAWRQKAIDCLPGCRREFEDRNATINDVFFELLSAVVEAHRQGDHTFLKKAYDFAAWCFDQKAQELWNAAGVSFYEHMGDRDETFSVFHLWVRKDIYENVRPLLEQRLDETQIGELERRYRRSRPDRSA